MASRGRHLVLVQPHIYTGYLPCICRRSAAVRGLGGAPASTRQLAWTCQRAREDTDVRRTLGHARAWLLHSRVLIRSRRTAELRVHTASADLGCCRWPGIAAGGRL